MWAERLDGKIDGYGVYDIVEWRDLYGDILGWVLTWIWESCIQEWRYLLGRVLRVQFLGGGGLIGVERRDMDLWEL